jgi:hypothetical protein
MSKREIACFQQLSSSLIDLELVSFRHGAEQITAPMQSWNSKTL